nr:hypothetical protein [uncultured Allobacillus sp.]
MNDKLVTKKDITLIRVRSHFYIQKQRLHRSIDRRKSIPDWL